jgi:hypothetical protein
MVSNNLDLIIATLQVVPPFFKGFHKIEKGQ